MSDAGLPEDGHPTRCDVSTIDTSQSSRPKRASEAPPNEPSDAEREARRDAWSVWALGCLPADARAAAVAAAMDAVDRGLSSEEASSAAFSAGVRVLSAMPGVRIESAQGRRRGVPRRAPFYAGWSRRRRILVAVGASVSLLVACLGAGVGVAHLWPGPDCGQSFFTAGGTIPTGDVGCGGFRLGRSLSVQDCQRERRNSAFRIFASTSGLSEQSGGVDPSPSSRGCELHAEPASVVTMRSVDPQPSPVVIIADFTPSWGGGFIELGWCSGTVCIRARVFPNRYDPVRYDLVDGETTLARGQASRATLDQGGASRFILRIGGGRVDAWLDGERLASAATTNGNGEHTVHFAAGAEPRLDNDIYAQRVSVYEAPQDGTT